MQLDPIIILSNLTELENDFYNFIQTVRSFNGWVVTLDEAEFKQVMDEFLVKNAAKRKVPPKYTLIEYVLDNKLKFKHSEFVDDLILKYDHLQKIGLSKLGYATYEVAELDKDWIFRITKAGYKKAREINNKKKS